MSRILAASVITLLMSGYAVARGHVGQGADFDGWGKKQHSKAVAAPEMDATSAGAAMVLLGGGLIVLFGRKTVKKS
jgi:hypothetical protein